MARTDWLDSIFKNGEAIDVFPLSVIHSELGDLGMFPQPEDLADVSKLSFRVGMKATYSYNYKTGMWSGSGTDLAQPISIPYQAGMNAVFRSRATPWPDLSEDTPLSAASYKGQAAALKAAPGDYPLFAPLLTV